MKFDVELVGKIGSMALIDKKDNMIDYSLVARISRQLKPGYIWVSSGATEIGRLDYMLRHGCELKGNIDNLKTDYAAQGQTILMSTYRQFVDPKYSLRQLLVEHHHFNDDKKRKHLKDFLIRCANQNAIPIINYNDAASFEENRKMEILALSSGKNKVVECVDNDETATQIACLVKSKILLILSSVNGIYSDLNDENTLIKEIGGKDADEVIQNIDVVKGYCSGSSRDGANGAKAKLEYIKEAITCGTKVYISNAKFNINDILSGSSPATVIGVR